MKVIIRGDWASHTGTDYCEALGIFNDLEAAEEDAYSYAWDNVDSDEDEEPKYVIEEYDPDKHDMLRAGGGSFEEDFKQFEKDFKSI